VNPQVDDIVGGGVVAIAGVTVGTAPPCGKDVQPAISTVSIAMHITGMTKEVFIGITFVKYNRYP
jgi:hypothetical protein